MRELLLIASAAAVMLAGFPFMKRADAFIARWARRADEEDAPDVAAAPDAEPQARKKAPAALRLSGMRVRRRAAPPKTSRPV